MSESVEQHKILSKTSKLSIANLTAQYSTERFAANYLFSLACFAFAWRFSYPYLRNKYSPHCSFALSFAVGQLAYFITLNRYDRKILANL